MEIVVQAIIIGIVQGLTEFLPISSSAHLILLPPLLGWDDALLNSAFFDVMLHLGTLVALLVYFWRELWRLLAAWLTSIRDHRIGADAERRLAWLLLVSVVPGAALGALGESFFDTFFRERLLVVCGLLVVGAAILFIAERAARHTRALVDLRLRDAIIIGIAQALALFPGISRSGITISAGLFLGLERPAAARFAFLMATPIIFGAGVWKSRELVGGAIAFDPLVLGAGMVASAVAGLVAIWALLAFLRRYSTDAFALYRVGFAVVAAALILGRGIA
jgi:undecaprenyl-diphosphatase